MCRALRAQGCDIIVATTDADGGGRLPVVLNRVCEYESVPTIFFRRQWSEAFKFSRPLSLWVREKIHEFDVVHIHAVFSHSCLAAAAACRTHGIPYVVRPLGTLDPWSLRQKPFRKRLMWTLAASRMLRGAAAVHYTTAEEKRLAETSLGINHGVVIPLGIEGHLDTQTPDDEFRQKYPQLADNPYILVLSRIHPKKNLESLLSAFSTSTLRPGLERWHLLIAGEGEPGYVASLRRLAEKNEVSETVIFTGWLSGTAKAAALEGAALLALISHQENFGLCAAEA